MAMHPKSFHLILILLILKTTLIISSQVISASNTHAIFSGGHYFDDDSTTTAMTTAVATTTATNITATNITPTTTAAIILSRNNTTNDQQQLLQQQPEFVTNNAAKRNVIAAAGRNAKLFCRVRNLADRAVSWIRKRDLHILTIGAMTYTNDQRFETQHNNATDEWMLKITSVQPRDAGIYECQVSTEPKISQAYRLTVVVAKAKILANPELVFKTGSDINLTCIAEQVPWPPAYIYWFKDGDLINYSQRGGINVLTERLMKTSKLLIARVVPADSGNYTCTPSNSISDSVYVHVINKEHPAAMQHESGSIKSLSKLLIVLVVLIAINNLKRGAQNFGHNRLLLQALLKDNG